MQDRHTAIDNFAATLPSPASVSGDRWWRRLSFYGVYDGHGGARASALLADRLHCLLAQELPRLPPPDVDRAVKRAILEAYKRADEEFLRSASKQRPHWRDGSTAVTALIVDNVAYIAHVGDSKAVLCQKKRLNSTDEDDAHRDTCSTDSSEQWSALVLTKDHSPLDYEERQRIQRSGAVVRDGRVDGVLEVSRSFGDYNFKKRGVSALPDVRKCRLDQDSRLLIIACDGLWHSVAPEEAAQLAADTWRREGGGRYWLERASSRLASEAVRRLCGDNVTVLLVSFDMNAL